MANAIDKDFAMARVGMTTNTELPKGGTRGRLFRSALCPGSLAAGAGNALKLVIVDDLPHGPPEYPNLLRGVVEHPKDHLD
jgi:hypothetical protein